METFTEFMHNLPLVVEIILWGIVCLVGFYILMMLGAMIGVVISYFKVGKHL